MRTNPLIRRRSFVTGALLAPLVAAACGRAPAEQESTSDIWAEFDAYLTKLTDEGKFSGAVLVTKDGEPLLESGYGWADEAAGEENTPATLFCIGSMGKMFTSVAMAQLVERGEVSYDDPIGTYLPEFPADVGSTVTIHHLLTHTAGMGDIFRGDDEITEENHSIAALLAYIVTQPLQFAPGARYSYSNAGFVTAGAIVERVTGRAYPEHMREHVFAPAGMTDTAVRTYRPADVPNLAHPYVLFGPDGQPVKAGPGRNEVPEGAELRDDGHVVKGGSPAGGSLSTVGDMIAFAGALTGHRLVGKELTDTILTGKVEMGGSTQPPTDAPKDAPKGEQKRKPVEPGKYAYGFVDRRLNGVRIVGHNGGTPGYEAELDIYPDTGHTVVILCNQDRVRQQATQRSEELLTS